MTNTYLILGKYEYIINSDMKVWTEHENNTQTKLY